MSSNYTAFYINYKVGYDNSRIASFIHKSKYVHISLYI